MSIGGISSERIIVLIFIHDVKVSQQDGKESTIRCESSKKRKLGFLVFSTTPVVVVAESILLVLIV